MTVSDITRPVPYRGDAGLLRPLLNRLEAAGIHRKNIRIVIGNGMHRLSTADERDEMFGADILREFPVDRPRLRRPGLAHLHRQKRQRRRCLREQRLLPGRFKDCDGTGREPLHGGAIRRERKAICPGLVDKRTIERFHSPAFLESPQAQNLILDGNPATRSPWRSPGRSGCDFIVNATLDRDLRPTGVFAGHIEAAHAAAAALVRNYVLVPVEREYDIVLTHGGYVGRNHYQAVKAAHNALPAIRKGGVLIIATDNRDAEPIGGPEYKSLLHMLKIQGADHYLKMIEAPGWRFTKDQWEPEMWAKVFRKIDEKDFVYCTHTIPVGITA